VGGTPPMMSSGRRPGIPLLGDRKLIYPPGLVVRPAVLLVAAAAALGAAPSAAADVFGAAQVRTSDGALLALANGESFSYPEDGSLVAIGSIATSGSRVLLRHVSLLNGRVEADRVVVTAKRTVVDGLVVAGLAEQADQNALFSVDGSSYLVARQTAVIGKKSGFVALRLVVPAGFPGFRRGAQVLVGLRQRGHARAAQTAVSTAGPEPWAALGFAQSPGAPNLWTVSEPMAGTPLVSLPPVADNGVGGRAVQIAAQFLGVPYRWGGARPDTGFDCSGLMMYVYAKLGISLTHYTGTQFHEGVPVPPAQLAPGDLVFFDASFSGPGHVGMYVGGGLFIHAPHTGDVVRITPLAAYASRFVGAIRPFA
jgi:cell wall-associated NlpC family hydrolase